MNYKLAGLLIILILVFSNTTASLNGDKETKLDDYGPLEILNQELLVSNEEGEIYLIDRSQNKIKLRDLETRIKLIDKKRDSLFLVSGENAYGKLKPNYKGDTIIKYNIAGDKVMSEKRYDGFVIDMAAQKNLYVTNHNHRDISDSSARSHVYGGKLEVLDNNLDTIKDFVLIEARSIAHDNNDILELDYPRLDSDIVGTGVKGHKITIEGKNLSKVEDETIPGTVYETHVDENGILMTGTNFEISQPKEDLKPSRVRVGTLKKYSNSGELEFNISLDSGSRPGNIKRTGKRGYLVTDYAQDKIYELNLDQRKIEEVINLRKTPTEISISNYFIYVLQEDGDIRVYDKENYEFLKNIKIENASSMTRVYS